MKELDTKVYDLETRNGNTSLLVILEAALNGHAIEKRPRSTPVQKWTPCGNPARMEWNPSLYNYRVKRPDPTINEKLKQQISNKLDDAFGYEESYVVDELLAVARQAYIAPIDNIIRSITHDIEQNYTVDYAEIVDRIAGFVDRVLLNR